MFLFDSSEPCLTKKKTFFQKILAFFLQFSDIIKIPGNWLLPRRPINYVGKFRLPEALAKHVPLFKNWQLRFWTGRPAQKYLAENKILLSLPPGKKESTERKKRGDNICWGKLALGNVTSHVMHVLTNI